MKVTALLLSAFALATVLSGQSKGRGKGKHADDSDPAALVSVSATFSESDRHVIQQWAQHVPPSGLPPGLAKRGELPPGLEKHLQKNGTLPPGLQKKISRFPDDLAGRLAPLPAGCGCDRVFVDGKALIITRAANVILDIVIVL
jgi:hypothetical protein